MGKKRTVFGPIKKTHLDLCLVSACSSPQNFRVVSRLGGCDDDSIPKKGTLGKKKIPSFSLVRFDGLIDYSHVNINRGCLPRCTAKIMPVYNEKKSRKTYVKL